MKEIIGNFGVFIGVGVLLHLAWAIWVRKVPAMSIASMLMWFVIDSLLVITTWLAGKPIGLPLAWTTGALVITVVLFCRGKWEWSQKETLSAICASAAISVSIIQGPDAGVIAATIALTVAGIPILVDMMRTPVRSTFYLWFCTCIACVCTIIASDKSLIGTFMAGGSLIYNTVLCFLVMRGTDAFDEHICNDCTNLN